MRTIQIVDAVPKSQSNETNDDAEPSIAVNPANPREIVITAFTSPQTGDINGPIYYSGDGGETWAVNDDVPGDGSNDQSIAFATASNQLYLATLRADAVGTQTLNVDRSLNPSVKTTFPIFESESGDYDQPWVKAITVDHGPDKGKDRLYVGFNFNSVATLHVFLDAANSATFIPISLETRTVARNGPHIRPVPHRDGTVYVAYGSWPATFGVVNLMVARDDDWGKNHFADLLDPTDLKPGRIVATVPINPFVGPPGQRGDNGFDIQVDPHNSDIVYLSWIDNSAPDPTLHVRRSPNRGMSWSSDLITVDNTSIATMAINSHGTVALSYLQFVVGKWEMHFRTSNDGIHWDDTLLARTPTNGFLGDYMRMVAVERNFYGVFPAVNTPDPANFFPNGGGHFPRYNRNIKGGKLLDITGTTEIAPSVDPFFFKAEYCLHKCPKHGGKPKHGCITCKFEESEAMILQEKNGKVKRGAVGLIKSLGIDIPAEHILNAKVRRLTVDIDVTEEIS